MGLPEDIKAIKDKIKEILENAILSETIKVVIIGDKTKVTKFDPPLIWVFIEYADIEDSGSCMQEFWELRVHIVGVIKDYDPEIGKDKSEALALSASGALMLDPVTLKEDRTLQGLIDDMSRVRWTPAYARISESDKSLFGSSMIIQMKLTNKEV